MNSSRYSTDEESREEEERCRLTELRSQRRGERSGRRDDRKKPVAVSEDGSLIEETFPQAILKLDRQHAIPRPRQKNDVLVEIEVSGWATILICKLLMIYDAAVSYNR